MLMPLPSNCGVSPEQLIPNVKLVASTAHIAVCGVQLHCMHGIVTQCLSSNAELATAFVVHFNFVFSM